MRRTASQLALMFALVTAWDAGLYLFIRYTASGSALAIPLNVASTLFSVWWVQVNLQSSWLKTITLASATAVGTGLGWLLR